MRWSRRERPKVVVITGAAAGVGRAAGRRAVAISVDVADREAVERAAEEVEPRLGPSCRLSTPAVLVGPQQASPQAPTCAARRPAGDSG